MSKSRPPKPVATRATVTSSSFQARKIFVSSLSIVIIVSAFVLRFLMDKCSMAPVELLLVNDALPRSISVCWVPPESVLFPDPLSNRDEWRAAVEALHKSESSICFEVGAESNRVVSSAVGHHFVLLDHAEQDEDRFFREFRVSWHPSMVQFGDADASRTISLMALPETPVMSAWARVAQVLGNIDGTNVNAWRFLRRSVAAALLLWLLIPMFSQTPSSSSSSSLSNKKEDGAPCSSGNDRGNDRKSGLLLGRHLSKAYAIVTMVIDHYAWCFETDLASRKSLQLTIPSQAGGAILFYWLVGRCPPPSVHSPSASRTSTVSVLIAFLVLDALFHLRFHYETLLAIASLRILLQSTSFQKTLNSTPLLVDALLCWVLIMSTRIVSTLFSYGSISIFLAIAGRLKTLHFDEKATMWLLAGAVLALHDLIVSSLVSLDFDIVADSIVAFLSLVAFVIIIATLASERLGNSLRTSLEQFLGQVQCKRLAAIISLMSRHSLAIYIGHVGLFYVMGGIRRNTINNSIE